MNKPSVFGRSGTGCQDLVVCSNIKKWRGVLHLAIFLILALSIALSVQTVYADGGSPPVEKETEIVVTTTEESDPDTNE